MFALCIIFVININSLISNSFLYVYHLCLQTCRTLLGKLTVDKHLYVRVSDEPVPAAPIMLQSLLRQGHYKNPSKSGRQYFANPMSTSML